MLLGWSRPLVLSGRKLVASLGLWSPGALDGRGWLPVELRRRSTPFPVPGRGPVVVLEDFLVVCASGRGAASVTLVPVEVLTAVGMLVFVMPELPLPCDGPGGSATRSERSDSGGREERDRRCRAWEGGEG